MTSAGNQVRGVGIIGAGPVSPDHGYALTRTAGLRLVGVAEPAEARCAPFAQLHPCQAYLDHRELLAESDFVVSCVPHTPETVKLIRLAQFKQMKPTAYFINISPGVVLALADLTGPLQQAQIAGAALDVFETEPLPSDHPLWGLENVLVAPPTGRIGPHIAQPRLDLLKENLPRLIAGEPLKNVVAKRRSC